MSQMSKLEERLNKAWEQRKESLHHVSYKSDRENFHAGAKFILELPELKALMKSLEFAASEDMWESNQNFDEWFKYKYTKWYQDEIKESLEQWRNFIGEESETL